MKRLFFIFLMVIPAANTVAQQFIPLWPEGKKPNFNGKNVTDSLYMDRLWRVGTPGMYVFIVPETENNGTSIMICPGGGYERLNFLYNGFNLARWYNTIGVNAFVLIYRLPHQLDLQQGQLAPLQDAQRAMRIIRANAGKWNIKTNKIGVMGISSGGHAASSLAIHADDVSSIKDSLDRTNYRPDFLVLLSPVITMGKYTHRGSKKYFIGPDSSKEMIERYSNELQVTASTPPTFIVHALNDSSVSVRNSTQLYNALLDKRVNASIHIFPKGAHNIRMDDNPGSTDYWLSLLEAWLKEMDLVNPIPFK